MLSRLHCWTNFETCLFTLAFVLNGEACKNTGIAKFIEIKSLSNFVKISTKRTNINTKMVYQHEEHLFFCSIVLFTLRRASGNNLVRCGRNNIYNKQFYGFA